MLFIDWSVRISCEVVLFEEIKNDIRKGEEDVWN